MSGDGETDRDAVDPILFSSPIPRLCRWIADRTSDKPGVRILDTETDQKITDDPIDVGLQPSAIGFVP